MDGSDNALLLGVRIHFEQSQKELWKMRQVFFFNLLISLAVLGISYCKHMGSSLHHLRYFPVAHGLSSCGPQA